MRELKEKSANLIAAIDVGTNSFHMIIASVDQRGVLTIKRREKEMVRLGSSAGDMKRITSDAIERAVETLKKFSEIAKSENAIIRAVATSATREAENQNEFIDIIKKETGIDIEIISGIEEGRLIYKGVSHALPIDTLKALIIDIGGGSTETIIGHKGELKYVNSAKLGAIRLTKQFFPDGNATEESIQLCREYIKGDWTPVLKRLIECGFEIVIGTAGTIYNLAVMSLAIKGAPIPDILNGMTIPREDLLAVIERIISAKKSEERAKLPGIDVKRADIILAGALILEAAIKNLNIQKILISSYSLREGVLYDKIEKIKAFREWRSLSHLRYESVINICKKYQTDLNHSSHVAKLAIRLFDSLQSIFNLTDYERELLESASLMHDIGYFISQDQHHKHSYYIIYNSTLPGFTNSETEIIANVARYHRKSHPKPKHENFKVLTPEKQRIVKILSGILRIAEGSDRRQIQTVIDYKISINSKTIEIGFIYDKNKIYPDIELWGALRRKILLEEITKREVSIKILENS